MNYRVEDVANVYESLLGNNHFSIKVNANFDVGGDLTQAIMFVNKQPFSIAEVPMETMQLKFEFFINVDSDIYKLDIEHELNAILGYKSIDFVSNGEQYTLNSYLNMGGTLSVPYMELGNFKQVYTYSGTCFINKKQGGVIISNDIETYLTFNGITDRVYLLSGSTNNIRDTDAPTRANQLESSAIVRAQGVARNINILGQKNELCSKLMQYIEVSENTPNLNAPIKLKRVYPDFVAEHDCVMVAGLITEEAGAPLSIQLGLQKKQ